MTTVHVKNLYYIFKNDEKFTIHNLALDMSLKYSMQHMIKVISIKASQICSIISLQEVWETRTFFCSLGNLDIQEIYLRWSFDCQYILNIEQSSWIYYKIYKDTQI